MTWRGSGGHSRNHAMKKVKFNVYISPELAQEVREMAFEHRLTLGEFFEAAARLELARLRAIEPEAHSIKLRTGRPLRPSFHEGTRRPDK